MRLIRIAATLMVTATVLIFIIARHAGLVADAERQGVSDGELREFVDDRSQLVVGGGAIAGLLIFAAIVLVVVALVRSRRKAP